jgi:hypothetical protein
MGGHSVTAARRIGALLAITLAATPVRDVLVAKMSLHMLAQVPLLLLAGWLLRGRATVRSADAPFDPAGAPGLLLSTAILTTWMIPRALDLAVTSTSVAWLQSVTLLLTGALLRGAWGRAGALGQAFFVGNLTWMAAVAGLLLRDAPVRLCTTYLERDQYYAGTGLLLLATACGVRWFTQWLAAPAAESQRPVRVR